MNALHFLKCKLSNPRLRAAVGGRLLESGGCRGCVGTVEKPKEIFAVPSGRSLSCLSSQQFSLVRPLIRRRPPLWPTRVLPTRVLLVVSFLLVGHFVKNSKLSLSGYMGVAEAAKLDAHKFAVELPLAQHSFVELSLSGNGVRQLNAVSRLRPTGHNLWGQNQSQAAIAAAVQGKLQPQQQLRPTGHSLWGGGSQNRAVSSPVLVQQPTQKPPPKKKASGGCSQESKDRARGIVEKYCDDKRNYPFVQCLKTSDNRYDVRAGCYGAGVKAILTNDKSYGIQIYKNCGEQNMTAVYTPKFEANCALDSQTHQVKVFLKILQDSADQANEVSFDPYHPFTAFQKEVQRTRAASRFLQWGADGPPMAPALFEVMDLKTGQPHAIQTMSYSQELLDGVDANTVRQAILQREEDNMYQQLKNLATMLPQMKSRAEFDQLIAKAEREIWMRFRLHIKLLDVIFAAVQEMHARSVVHCDLHFGNIMILRKYINTQEELLRRTADGTAVLIPTMPLSYSSGVLPDGIDAWLKVVDGDGNVGIPAYILEPTSVMVIDAAYVLAIGHKITVDAAPCLLYRAQRQEDLNELWRGGMNIVFNDQRKADLFGLAVQNMQKDFPTEWNNLMTQRPDANAKIQDVFNKRMNMLSHLAQSTLSEPNLAGCQKMVPALRTVTKLVRQGRREEAVKLLPATCTFDSQKAGITAIRSIIQQEVNTTIPPDARMSFQLPSASPPSIPGAAAAPLNFPSSPTAPVVSAPSSPTPPLVSAPAPIRPVAAPAPIRPVAAPVHPPVAAPSPMYPHVAAPSPMYPPPYYGMSYYFPSNNFGVSHYTYRPSV